MEGGDDPRPKMRPSDPCPFPLSPKCLLTPKWTFIFLDPVLIPALIQLTLNFAWLLESISHSSALLISSSLGNPPRNHLYLLRHSHSLGHLLLAELFDHTSLAAIPVFHHRYPLSTELFGGINSSSHSRGMKLGPTNQSPGQLTWGQAPLEDSRDVHS